MPEDMSDRVPEDMPDRMPEDLPDRMPEDMPDHMPEDMPDRMSNRMSEDMSDRMPEDLPVRKCINVMVGITRSKVIFHSVGNFIIPTDFHSIIFQRGRRTNHQADIISYYSNINVDISHIIPYYLHIPTRYYTSSLGFFQATDLLSPGPAPGHQRHGLQT